MAIPNPHTTQIYTPPAFVDSHRLVKIQSLLPEVDLLYREYADANHYPGYAYGIVLDGELIHVDCGGYSDLERHTPVTGQTMFRIASMTKSFVAMALLILRDEGKLRLDDPLSLYLPEINQRRLTADSPDITIRDLLTHAAGFPSDNPWADRKLDEEIPALIALLNQGLSFSTSPGTHCEYSNLGYALLGYVIQVASGLPYETFINERVLQPIGMTDVAWDFKRVPTSQLAQGYAWESESWKAQEMLGNGIYGAIGGVITSIEAFSHYMALHLSAWPPRNEPESPPIKRSSLREMHQPWRFVDLVAHFNYADGAECSVTSGYGYGLRWSQDSLGKIFVGHSGGLPGFGSNWTILPEYGLGVILFANVTYGATAKINLEVLHKLVVDAQLAKRPLPVSKMLEERRSELLKLLPDWTGAEQSNLFAKNFFLDRSIDALAEESKGLFKRAGKIISVGDIVPENQLRGAFVLKCQHRDLEVTFALSPENPPLIQEYHLKEIGSDED